MTSASMGEGGKKVWQKSKNQKNGEEIWLGGGGGGRGQTSGKLGWCNMWMTINQCDICSSKSTSSDSLISINVLTFWL